MYPEHHPIRCVERAIEFIECTLNDEQTPSLAATAEASHLSKYHFHRVFRLVTGETFAETITRLKLARGADALKRAETSVTDAAFLAGYGSSQAFAKALKRELDMTATNLRRDPERIAKTVKSLSTPENKARVVVELASLEPFEIVARRTEGIYPALNETYYSLFEMAGGPEVVEAIIGLPFGDIGKGDTLVFDCGLKLSQWPDELLQGFRRQDVEGGQYLLTQHVGPYEGLPESLDTLYAICLRTESLSLPDTPCVFHYLDDPEETPEENLRTDIYLKIKKEA